MKNEMAVCGVCGKEFIKHNGRQVTCSHECSEKNNEVTRRNAAQRAMIKRRVSRDACKKNDNEAKFNEIINNAKKEGMSYGQYVMQLYLKEQNA